MSVVTYTTFDGELVEENRDGTILDYVPDSLGSVIMWVDETGLPAGYTPYWPYGEPWQEPEVECPFQFGGTFGYYRDLSGTYVRARVYEPEEGRWMTVDPLWPEEPAFAYSNCSPLSYLDPTGLRPSRDLWGLCFREGIGTCYSTEEGFKNCCTKCGQCFTKEMECSNSVAAFPGSGFRCGDILLCCSKKVCVVVVVKDTGSGGPGRIIDFGCCFSKKVGLSGLEPITCFKVGTKKLKRECNTTEQCERKYGPAGKFCPREKKKKK